MMKSGTVENFSTFNPFPVTLGRDFSGVVVDKGMDANEYQVGDQVQELKYFNENPHFRKFKSD